MKLKLRNLLEHTTRKCVLQTQITWLHVQCRFYCHTHAWTNPLEPHHLEQKLDVSVSGSKALHLSFGEPEVVSSVWQRPHNLSDQWVVVSGLLVRAHVSKNIVSVNHWPVMCKRKSHIHIEKTVILLYLIYSKFSISLHCIIFVTLNLSFIWHSLLWMLSVFRKCEFHSFL